MCRMGLLSFIVLSFDFCVIVHVISLSLTDKIVVFGAKSIHFLKKSILLMLGRDLRLCMVNLLGEEQDQYI